MFQGPIIEMTHRLSEQAGDKCMGPSGRVCTMVGLHEQADKGEKSWCERALTSDDTTFRGEYMRIGLVTYGKEEIRERCRYRELQVRHSANHKTFENILNIRSRPLSNQS